jgi:phosphatidylserine decarboxylase
MAVNMLDTFIKPMHPEGWRFVGIFGAVTVLAFLICQPLGWICLGLTVWCYYFFRDPKRAVPLEPGLILSPADGVVSLIEPAVPPAELGLGSDALMRVSVFMSVFNCHVNRLPIEGRITAIAYRPGKFLNASLDKASVDNERNALAVELPDGRKIAVVQIAGLVARRILCWAKEGQHMRAGDRFGLIRFGSRLDVYLPNGVEPEVAIGQTMIAGESIIARLDGPAAPRLARIE